MIIFEQTKKLIHMAKVHTPPISGFNSYNTTKVNSLYWINPESFNWMIGDQDTGIDSRGIPGISPVIGSNGNWWVGNRDTGVPANGVVNMPSPATDTDIFD